jgi:hypothetical protein
MHKPSNCEGKAHKFTAKEGKQKRKEAPGTDECQLKMTKAYKACIKQEASTYMDSDLD